MGPTTTSVTEGTDLTGKTALVTGSSSGIGRECARILAVRGARVLMANRNEKKTGDVISELTRSIGSRAAQHLEYRECDTSRMHTVHALADSIAATGERIDLLFLNAGVFGMEFQITEDGFERTLATNYIGHFLLVHRLLTAGLLSGDARIIATQTSGIRNPFSKMNLEMLENPGANRDRYRRSMSSPDSKVMLALMMTEFARRVAPSMSGVTFNSGDPGATLTDNVNQLSGMLGTISRALGPHLFKSADQGAAVLIWVATNSQLVFHSGQSFSHQLRPMRLPTKCTNPDAARRAWDITESILRLKRWR